MAPSDFFLYATACCDNVKAFHTLGRRYGIPSFGMERSYHPYTAHAMEHWKNEYKRLIAFLEEQTGTKMDYDRLKEVVALLPSHRAPHRDRQTRQPMSRVRCPPNVIAGTLLAIRLLPGTQQAIDFLTELRDELQERVNQGIAAIKNERFRVMWSSFTPFFDPTLQSFMMEKYGAISVTDMLSHWRGAPNADPWASPMDARSGGSAGQPRLPDPAAPGNCQYSPGVDVGREPQRPGPQVQGGWGDLQQQLGLQDRCGLGPILKDELIRQVGVPTLTLHCDVIDQPSSAGRRSRARWTASSR